MPKPTYDALMAEVKSLREQVQDVPEIGDRPSNFAVMGKLKKIVRTKDIGEIHRLAKEAMDRL
jgi:hypothetical protein